MAVMVGVSFKRAGKIYHFDSQALSLNAGDMVVVETTRGMEMGKVMSVLKDGGESQEDAKPVLRQATEDDMARHAENICLAEDALAICREKVLRHNLVIKLIDALYVFDRTKIIFYFTSDGRVDFRELVKDLASVFRTRIEMRQVGVRDEAKILGGFGICGRSFCCHDIFDDFHPVSIKMAKKQNISLNPAKISGVCGRLMCCLRYEFYNEAKNVAKIPDTASSITTEHGVDFDTTAQGKGDSHDAF